MGKQIGRYNKIIFEKIDMVSLYWSHDLISITNGSACDKLIVLFPPTSLIESNNWMTTSATHTFLSSLTWSLCVSSYGLPNSAKVQISAFLFAGLMLPNPKSSMPYRHSIETRQPPAQRVVQLQTYLAQMKKQTCDVFFVWIAF